MAREKPRAKHMGERKTNNLDVPGKWLWLAAWMLGGVLFCGCGTTQSQSATQQLLLSDAVDRAVARIDFRPLTGHSVFLDDRYVQTLRTQGVGFVNADYIVSSLRQQMLAADCQLQDRVDTADFVVEVRIGALGMDGHEVTYGIPPNSPLNNAVNAVPNSPNLSIPEIAFAKRNDQMGAAKVAVFAYDRDSRTPVWQSGTSVAISDAKNVWVLGAGPFQRGTIYNGTRFAGSRLNIPLAQAKSHERTRDSMRSQEGGDTVSFEETHTFTSEGMQEDAEEGELPTDELDERFSEPSQPPHETGEILPEPISPGQTVPEPVEPGQFEPEPFAPDQVGPEGVGQP
jgi:hypothetical protein